tara:strand:+ start:437159 stop:438028 length:870 start_codon:yes stop_codon:yes gene_type:complete
MLNFADDNGNQAYSAKRLKMQIFPADAIDTQPLLDELLTHGIIIEYSMNDEKFLHIKGFRKHQVINRPSATKIPEPNFDDVSTQSNDDSLSTHGAISDGREGKGRERKGDSAPNGAGVPPTEKIEEPKSPADMNKDELWSVGKSILLQQGMPAAQCGSFVGKLVKDYGTDIVIEVVRAAVVERPADAVSFLKASCMARKNEGGKTLVPWHATDEGVAEKGLSLDPPIRALPGESARDFKTRIIKAVENGGKAPVVRSNQLPSVQAVDEKSEKPAGIPDLKSFVRPRAVA